MRKEKYFYFMRNLNKIRKTNSIITLNQGHEKVMSRGESINNLVNGEKCSSLVIYNM